MCKKLVSYNLFRGCFGNRTRFELSYMSESSDEEVDYGSFDSFANRNTDSDHAWSASENDSLE